MRYLMIALCAVMLSVSTEAGELTLSETIRLAGERSFELKAARAREESARHSTSASRRARFPSLSIEGRIAAVDDLPVFEFDIPTGPSLKREIGAKESYQIDAYLTLPLYTGGRIGGSIDQAEAFARISEAMALAESERVSLAARVEYYSLGMAGSMVRTADASLQRAEIIAGSVLSMFEAGAADSVDLLEADLAVTEASFALSRARIERRSAEIRLQMLLGIDTSEHLTIASLPSPPESLPGGRSGMPDRPELEAASARIEAGEAALEVTGSGRLPSISLFGGYSIGKPNRDMFEAETDDYFRVGLGLSWSLNLGGAEGERIEAARLEVDALRRERERIERDLGEAADLALERMRLAHEEYLSSKRRLELTSRNFRLAERRHREGDLPTSRLLEIEKSLTAAQADLAASEAAYYMRYSGWLYATGSEELEKGTI